VVATESLLVIATDVVQAPNDKQQIAPMLEKIVALSEELGQVETLLADNGYFSEANVMVCVAANVEPRSRQGKEVGDRRCGKAIEAKPSSGQIKPSRGPYGRDRTRRLKRRLGENALLDAE
jgi:hypothetical protein